MIAMGADLPVLSVQPTRSADSSQGSDESFVNVANPDCVQLHDRGHDPHAEQVPQRLDATWRRT